jgi:adenylate kinase
MHGPPGSGKTHYSRKIAQEYYLPHVTIKDAINEVLEGPPSEIKQRIQKTIDDSQAQAKTQKKKPKKTNKKKKKGGKAGDDDERPRLPTDLLTLIMQKKLQTAPCRNKGFVLDGYPRTREEAEALFMKQADAAEDEDPPAPEEGEEGEEAAAAAPVSASGNIIPQFVLTFSCTEETAARRSRDMPADQFVDGHNDEDGFRRRWTKFVTTNDPQQADSQSPLSTMDGIEILEIQEELADDEAKARNAIEIYLEQGSRPFNYHPTPEEALARASQAEADAKVQEEQDSKEQEQKQKVEASEREATQLANRMRRELVLQEDQLLVEAASLPLRKYLMRSVVPALVDGLLDVCKMQPDDPIDSLAEFLFNYATAHVDA